MAVAGGKGTLFPLPVPCVGETATRVLGRLSTRRMPQLEMVAALYQRVYEGKVFFRLPVTVRWVLPHLLTKSAKCFFIDIILNH
ncbi:hypothetical protein NDU88_007741 [Pleurodeles waltl]|uniref:Uncharacterized protein n=1 Tax=Pleurodeles waltl TaxID=8319 RepID=A0AAV7NTX9_PLEWA|nr:hypothetical protein NDU88_007741 [Pleurodeles waltl]